MLTPDANRFIHNLTHTNLMLLALLEQTDNNLLKNCDFLEVTDFAPDHEHFELDVEDGQVLWLPLSITRTLHHLTPLLRRLLQALDCVQIVR